MGDRRGHLLVEVTMVLAVYAITGWLAAAGYYRWGVLRGMLFLVPAVAPVAAADGVLVTVGAQAPVAAVLAWWLVVAVLGALAAHGVTRTMPLRRAAGWTV